jgi:hypothetical protein
MSSYQIYSETEATVSDAMDVAVFQSRPSPINRLERRFKPRPLVNRFLVNNACQRRPIFVTISHPANADDLCGMVLDGG